MATPRRDGRKGWPESCAWCRGGFMAYRIGRRFCSSTCGSRADAATRGRSSTPKGERARRRGLRDRSAPGLGELARRRLRLTWVRQGRTCTFCDGPAETVDHVIPLARGGTNYEGNLVPACRSCNSSRSDLFISEWKTRAPRARRLVG